MAFCDGSHPQIHPLIITLHARLTTKVQLNGFFKAVYSINGNPPARSCGYTENVRYSWPSSRDDPRSSSLFIAGSGKSVIWFAFLRLVLLR